MRNKRHLQKKTVTKKYKKINLTKQIRKLNFQHANTTVVVNVDALVLFTETSGYVEFVSGKMPLMVRFPVWLKLVGEV